MADAQASGACGSNIVRVQVPLPALFFCLEAKQSEAKTLIVVKVLTAAKIFTVQPVTIPFPLQKFPCFVNIFSNMKNAENFRYEKYRKIIRHQKIGHKNA